MDHWSVDARDHAAEDSCEVLGTIHSHPYTRGQRGGVVWLITGRGQENNGIPGHPSDDQSWLKPDRTIDNSGRLEDLYYLIDEALGEPLAA